MKLHYRKLGIVFIMLSIIFYILYVFLGVEKIQQPFMYTNKLESQIKENSIRQLRDHPNLNFYNGIFAQKIFFNDKLYGLWIVNFNGLKYHKVSASTKFSYFSLCKDQRWMNPQQRLSKNDNINYKDWLKMIRQGDYIQVITDKENNAVTTEIIGYDWWAFSSKIPVNYFQTRCQN